MNFYVFCEFVICTILLRKAISIRSSVEKARTFLALWEVEITWRAFVTAFSSIFWATVASAGDWFTRTNCKLRFAVAWLTSFSVFDR